ncbi:M3 family metallopeptidase [Novosphingobium profundi]|uniref:M3 family metallopeptidase n=1 Tax=Novosphingobium profundi TaxID=1774954 RepID=UPI001BD9E3F8|nr:M3 family metallopeptidase [Novosphingobium profundi]MBT0666915.1 M3 family metallopeptidase [Novosphingobium profundi]
MKNRLLAAAAPAVLASLALSGTAAMTLASPALAADAAPKATAPYDGVFAKPSTLPFHAPDFAKIKDSDWKPAIEAGIAQKRAEMKAIANNTAAPTFANTLVAMERAGVLYDRVYNVFSQLTSANTSDALDAVDTEVSPQIAAMEDAIYLDPKLFARVKAVHDSAAGKALTGEDAMLLKTQYAKFVHRGALLSPAQKTELKAMNTEISTLETQFAQQLTQANNAHAVVFDSKEQLAGLSDAQIAAAAERAAKDGKPGKYVLPLINYTQQPVLAQLTNRESRRRVFEESINRASSGDQYDTTGIVTKIATLRAKKAKLLGQPDFGTFQMYDRMINTPAKAMTFMKGFVPALRATQDREAGVLLEAAKADGVTTLQPWDWTYYAEKVRKAKYDLDESAIKPYFEVYNVLENGVFYAANKTYGLTFKRRTDLPVYHPTMRVYEVIDSDGKTPLGLFYFDPFSRPSKRGGAWMNNFVEQSNLLGEKPVIANTLNIDPPAEGQPALASWDDVTTMFHEFGHALHGFFAHQQYPALSGTNTARDFVEFPSQFNENFATVPEVLAHYAKHYKTGAPLPAGLLDKIDAAGKFNQSVGFGETLEAAMLDIKWHTLTPEEAAQPPIEFEKQALASLGLRTDLIPPRYRTPYFRHIWDNGYASGYYSYIWTEVLAHDGWDWVEKHGGMTRANGDHIRTTFLGQGHSKDLDVLYRDFTGHDPELEPMLEARGLSGK